MNSRILAALIIPVATVILTSNSFSVEILTDFDAEKIYPENSDKISAITLKNIGLIQAKDVMANIQFDSKVTISDIDCLEGNISHKENTISVGFTRMSTNVFCTIDFPKSSNYNTTNILITSDDRSAVYPELKYIRDFWTPVLVIFGIIIAFELVMILYIFKIVYEGLLILFSRYHKNITCWKKIKMEIKNTHNVTIDSYDVSILCSIINEKNTGSQISADTKITKKYVNQKISFLQKNDILLFDKIEIYKSIEESIKKICDEKPTDESNPHDKND